MRKEPASLFFRSVIATSERDPGEVDSSLKRLAGC